MGVGPKSQSSVMSYGVVFSKGVSRILSFVLLLRWRQMKLFGPTSASLTRRYSEEAMVIVPLGSVQPFAGSSQSVVVGPHVCVPAPWTGNSSR